jgi:hypothetical protein
MPPAVRHRRGMPSVEQRVADLERRVAALDRMAGAQGPRLLAALDEAALGLKRFVAGDDAALEGLDASEVRRVLVDVCLIAGFESYLLDRTDRSTYSSAVIRRSDELHQLIMTGT